MHDISLASPLRIALDKGPELAVIIPTLNERTNIDPLIARLDDALAGIAWEAIFVDDNSTDGTSDYLREVGRMDRRVRCIRRIGRRGLSSACIEGMLSTSAPYIAVIDADLQHDESLLPQMLDVLKGNSNDLVVASRYVSSGAAEGLSSKRRRLLSRAGAWLAQTMVKSKIADPVSGFFMMRSGVVERSAENLCGIGMKILIDLMASHPGPLSVTELPYRFRNRYSGSSKLDCFTILEYLALLAEKMTRGYLPSKLLMFGLVGASGLMVHLALLSGLLATGVGFVAAQSMAATTAMMSNYFLNNTLTYRDCRLVGWAALRGLISFMAVCGLGAAVNVLVARDIYALTQMWLVAGLAGSVVGAFFNYALTSMFTWKSLK